MQTRTTLQNGSQNICNKKIIYSTKMNLFMHTNLPLTGLCHPRYKVNGCPTGITIIKIGNSKKLCITIILNFGTFLSYPGIKK